LKIYAAFGTHMCAWQMFYALKDYFSARQEMLDHVRSA